MRDPLPSLIMSDMVENSEGLRVGVGGVVRGGGGILRRNGRLEG